MLVPHRRRDRADIHLFALADVLQQRAAIDLARLVARRVAHVVAPPSDQVHLGALRRQAEREIDARHRGQDIGEHPVAFGEPRHLVEHHGRIAHAPLIDIQNAADLLFRLGTADDLQFAGLLDLGDPVAQILVGHGHPFRAAGFARGAVPRQSRRDGPGDPSIAAMANDLNGASPAGTLPAGALRFGCCRPAPPRARNGRGAGHHPIAAAEVPRTRRQSPFFANRIVRSL